ncbi:MAG: ferritin [Candidatus Bipolaricaulota bacterium]|nr:ferritin [Candidatus Bipolaricaulota bacterium]MBS3792699.1 ferritin [Candidatus Bipolaricaulota bacterium]
MLDKTVEKSLNDQINEELNSYYIYLSMEAYFESESLDGFATWMEHQAQEEMEHAMRIFRYLNERGGRVKLQPIEEPKSDWNSPQEAFEDAYDHEQYITNKIDELVDLAEEKNDKATRNMLDWFVEEQVEEEASTEAVVDKIKIVGESGPGLLSLDNALGQRQTTDE